MYNIEYVNYVGQHPLTSSHPHYQSIYNNPPERYTFSANPSDNPKYNAFLNDLGEQIDDAYFIQRIHDGARACPDVELSVSPTLPYIGPTPNFLFLEDWSDIFTFLMNERTVSVDLNNQYFASMAAYMARPHFKGVITHMKQTVEDLKFIMRNRVDEKMIYLPIGLKEAGSMTPTRFNGEKIRILMSNSYGAPEGNFFVRGGVEGVTAVMELIEQNYPLELTIVGPTPSIAYQICKNRARIIPNFIDDATFSSIMNTTDIFLIPAMRIHSISVARAMCLGIVPIVSDGWGFNEFVEDGITGLVAKGQLGYTTFHDDVFRSNYDERKNSRILVDNIKEVIKSIVFDNKLQEISDNAKEYASINFNIEKRNRSLKDIFDNAKT